MATGALSRITIDHIDGTTYFPERPVQDVSLESARETVERLDGVTRTMVVLEGAGDAWPKLIIGGRRGAFIVMYTRNGSDAGWWQLMSNGDSSASLTMIVGGQDGDYALNLINDDETMWRAVEHFFETGDMDSALHWERG